MHQDSFRSVVCRSLSKSLPSRSKDGSYPETAQCAVPCVVTLQPTVCRGCQCRTVCRGCQCRDWNPSQSNREERSMLSHRDYLMSSSLSKHFAEDLLRGAMDLQESLVMLEKFQTASRSMRQSNKKRRPENGEKSPEITGIHEALLEASNAKKVVSGSIKNGLDGKLRNSTDELKKVIKDSLYRKNLLAVSSNDEQASLSQPSWYTPNNSAISKSTEQKKVVPRSFPSCAPVRPDKSKSPSLVAKLMGLDGLPRHNANTIKKDEAMKTVSSPRARFDTDMPKSKKPPPQIFGEDCRIDIEMPTSEKLPRQLFGEDPDRKGKAEQEIMEAMQFKRLFKTMKVDEHKVQQHNVRMNFPYSQKDILPSHDTSVVNELGSMKSIQKEKGIEQARTKAPKDIKVVSHISRKQQIKETSEIGRRSRDKQKTHLTDRKGKGRKDMNAKTASPSRTNAKLVKNPDKNLIASIGSPSMCRTKKPILRETHSNSREKTVSSRKVKNSTIDDIVAYEVHREFIQIDSPSSEHSATPSDEICQSADWDTQPCMDDVWEDLSESNEASQATSPVERINSTDEDAFQPSIDRISTKEAEIKDEMNLLLLSDQSFLTRVGELIGSGAYQLLIEQYKGIPKAQMKNRELYVDTAAEQLERKHRLQNCLCYTGFRGQKGRATACFSLEALLSDVSNGTRKLNSYTDDDDCSTKDSLYMKLERDLRCTDASINSVWDMGWQDWICMEETERFIRDVGDSILSLLIEEAAFDMWVN